MVVAGIVAQYGVDALFMCTMMAGVLLVIMGLTGTGTAVRFIPRPVVIGFTNGIALVIASTQLKDFFGIPLETVPGEFIGRIAALVGAMTRVIRNHAAGRGGARRRSWSGTGSCRACPATSWRSSVAPLRGDAGGLSVETIGSRFGGIPAGLPQFQIPRFRPDLILTLVSPTLTIAMLGAIESLLSAVVADRMSGTRHNSNVELFAQGIANIASPLVGRPSGDRRDRAHGDQRPIRCQDAGRGIIHALTLLLILLFAAPLAAMVPMAVLAAILLVVAYNMGEWREIPELWKQGWTDRLVWMVTFALTVLADLTVAVEAGMILAALLFIRRVAATTTVTRVYARLHPAAASSTRCRTATFPDYVTIIRIQGPFLFGATDKLTAMADASGGAEAGRHPSASQHDGDRRDRAESDRGLCGRDSRVRTGAAALRCAVPADAADAACRVPPPRRRREHPVECRCGAPPCPPGIGTLLRRRSSAASRRVMTASRRWRRSARWFPDTSDRRRFPPSVNDRSRSNPCRGDLGVPANVSLAQLRRPSLDDVDDPALRAHALVEVLVAGEDHVHAILARRAVRARRGAAESGRVARPMNTSGDACRRSSTCELIGCSSSSAQRSCSGDM